MDDENPSSPLESILRLRRVSPGTKDRKIIRQKTGGLCHICGGELGPKWAADHITPVAKGGGNEIDNFLPACGTCNRLKWHRKPEMIRFIMQLGIYAKKEIERDSRLGRDIAKLFDQREAINRSRRKPKIQAEHDEDGKASPATS